MRGYLFYLLNVIVRSCVYTHGCHIIRQNISYQHLTILQQCAVTPQATPISPLNYMLIFASLQSSLSASGLFCPCLVVCVCLWRFSFLFCFFFTCFSDVFLCVWREWVMWLWASSWALPSYLFLCLLSRLCCLYSVWLLSDKCVVWESGHAFECVHMSSVSVFLQNQPSKKEKKISARHAHRTSSPVFYSLPRGLRVDVCTYTRFQVYACVFLCMHVHSCIFFPLLFVRCKKIDLGSVTAGPAGIRGLNGCLSQRNTHFLPHAPTHTGTGLRPPSPSWTCSVEYRFRLLSR